MLCPFLTDARETHGAHCVETNCALWLAGEGVCSFRGIAEKLNYIEDIANQVDETKEEQ